MQRIEPRGGFTLLESLVALAILGVALLLGMALVLQQPRLLRRLDARREALRALDSTLEAIRAGVLPLQSSQLDGFVTSAGSGAPRDLVVFVEVTGGGRPDLYLVTLRARYSVYGQSFEPKVQTLFWRQAQPPPLGSTPGPEGRSAQTAGAAQGP